MAVLTIRNLPDEVRDRLRLRAARADHSMKAEVRAILTRASREPDGTVNSDELQDWVDRLYGETRPDDFVEQLIQDRFVGEPVVIQLLNLRYSHTADVRS